MVSGNVCPECDGRLVEARLPSWLSQWPGLYSEIHARTTQPRRGQRCHAYVFQLLREETNPAVRVVLGHFVFGYIHPYMDGNDRMGRFLMNLMLVSGGYPWTVVPVGDRKDYMEDIEKASVDEEIGPFISFLADLVDRGLSGKPLPGIPEVPD